MCVPKDIYSNDRSSFIHNSKKVERIQMSINSDNTMWSIHTMQYYWVINRNEVLIGATTWMNLGDMMLGEKRQSQKTTLI